MTQTEAQRAEKNRESFRNYYHANKDDYNARRRAKYAKDKEARKKARERAAKYRKEKPTIERELRRELNGRMVRVFSTGEVAQEMGRTPQMLRNWEKEGMVPESVFPDQHRLYTKKQKSMIIKLGETIAANGGSWSSPAVKKAVARMHTRW